MWLKGITRLAFQYKTRMPGKGLPPQLFRKVKAQIRVIEGNGFLQTGAIGYKEQLVRKHERPHPSDRKRVHPMLLSPQQHEQPLYK
ncbi:MAG: hypothetical protein MRJ67_09630 [Nitrospirales bacterium]|nr:hypothetical protein [Nitrospira sp.]MDR4460759.1 hypothetical protein [Nitrospirales bacterium]